MAHDASLYLAIDQGGHASRAIVFDGLGEVVAEAFVEVQTTYPQRGWVEHDPRAVVESIDVAINQVVKGLGPRVADVTAAGLATQRSSLVCWDRVTGEALSPVISWQDHRAARWLEQFKGSAAAVHEQTGLVISAHYGASKLRWCLDHLPEVGEALQESRLAWGPLVSFLLFRILAERPLLVDPANAARTLLWDLRTRDWSQALLDLFGLPREPLPRCVPSRHRCGHLRIGTRAVPLVVATGDQSAALFAFGPPRPDTVYVNVGTGAFVQRVVGDQPVAAPRLLSSVVWQEADRATYTLEGAVNGAGSALDQVRTELGLDTHDADAQTARWLEEPCDPPLFLNGVSGLGSPFWVSDFPSRFVGNGEARERIVAVAESIVFLLKVNLDELAAHGPEPDRLLITGGLAAMDGLCQRLADLSGMQVERPQARQATARGLAYLVAGQPPHWQPQSSVTDFRPAQNPALRKRFDRWHTQMLAALNKR